MKRVWSLLKEEHAVFRRAAREIEASLGRPGELIRPALIKSLKFLLPALRRHEEIEHALFAGLFDVMRPEDVELRRILDLQHDALEGLCKDMQLLLRHAGEYSLDHLRALGRLLTRNLSDHLGLEEKRLWPRMRGRFPGAGRAAHIERLVRRLEAAA